MMTENDYRHFVCIVAGENPDSLMKEYDSKSKTTPKVIYRYSDLDKVKQTFISEYEERLKYCTNELEEQYIKDSIYDLKEMSVDDFAFDLTDSEDRYYIDDETGDIMTDCNPNGRWSYFQLGKAFSLPFLTFDGREIFQSLKKDIDWNKIHLSGKRVYERVWEMVMENSTPNDEHEEVLYENMKDKEFYFKKFETKENYVISNTAFWGYAFLSEKTGWIDAEDVEDQFEWMSNFYKDIIKI